MTGHIKMSLVLVTQMMEIIDALRSDEALLDHTKHKLILVNNFLDVLRGNLEEELNGTP